MYEDVRKVEVKVVLPLTVSIPLPTQPTLRVCEGDRLQKPGEIHRDNVEWLYELAPAIEVYGYPCSSSGSPLVFVLVRTRDAPNGRGMCDYASDFSAEKECGGLEIKPTNGDRPENPWICSFGTKLNSPSVHLYFRDFTENGGEEARRKLLEVQQLLLR